MFLIVVLTLLFGRPFAEFAGAGWTTAELLKTMGLVVLIDATLNWVWLSLRSPRPPSKDWCEMIDHGWGFLIFVVVLFGPIMEEVIFRYLLVGALYDVSPVLAIGLSGVLFGLVHSRSPLLKIVMGCMYAWIYVQSGSFWVPLALHMFWNAAVLFLARKELNRRMPVWRRY